MNRFAKLCVPVFLMGVAGGPLAAQDKVPVAEDLTAVIALQGLPCGKVVKTQEQGENDYIATCEDGNRYRVYVNPDGRVVAAKL